MPEKRRTSFILLLEHVHTMEELTDEEVQKEVRRASAVKGTAEVVIKLNQLVLEASKTALEYGLKQEETDSLMIEQRTSK